MKDGTTPLDPDPAVVKADKVFRAWARRLNRVYRISFKFNLLGVGFFLGLLAAFWLMHQAYDVVPNPNPKSLIVALLVINAVAVAANWRRIAYV